MPQALQETSLGVLVAADLRSMCWWLFRISDGIRGVRHFDSAHFAEIRQSPPTSEVCTSVPSTDACLVSMGFALGSSIQIRPTQLNSLPPLAKISTFACGSLRALLNSGGLINSKRKGRTNQFEWFLSMAKILRSMADGMPKLESLLYRAFRARLAQSQLGCQGTMVALTSRSSLDRKTACPGPGLRGSS